MYMTPKQFTVNNQNVLVMVHPELPYCNTLDLDRMLGLSKNKVINKFQF